MMSIQLGSPPVVGLKTYLHFKKTWAHVGTGLLLATPRGPELITAKHVYDQLDVDRVLYGHVSGYSWSFGSVMGWAHDSLDVCSFPLPAHVWRRACGEQWTLIPPPLATPLATKPECYMVVGCRSSRNTPRSRKHPWDMSIDNLALSEAPQARYTALGWDPGSHLVLENPSERWMSEDGQPAPRPIRPVGMSGCPVFALHAMATDVAFEFAGVFVEWREKRDTYICVRSQPITKWLNPFWATGLSRPW